MKKTLISLIKEYYGTNVKKCLEGKILEKYLDEYPNEEDSEIFTNALHEIKNNHKVTIDEQTLKENTMYRLYRAYILAVKDYILENNLKIASISVNKYLYENEIGHNSFEFMYLNSINELDKSRVLTVTNNSIRIYHNQEESNKTSYSKYPLDFSQYIIENWHIILNIFDANYSDREVKESFNKKTEFMYIYKFKFDEIELPLLSFELGYDAFSCLRLDLEKCLSEDIYNNIKW